MLTERQQEVLDFITTFFREKGYTPTIREIAAQFGVQVHAAHGHIKALEKKGLLVRAGGKGRALQVVNNHQPQDEVPSLFRLPLVAAIPAGATVAVEDQLDNFMEVSPQWFTKGGNVVAVRIMGESMAGDAIRDGDIAIIKLQKIAGAQDIVAVRVFDEEVTLKRVFQKGAEVELRPSNPEFPTRKVPADQVEVIGKLVGIIRKTS